ncbi:MAG: PCMD domain-containing protein [Muribaculaceae bacterium]|nr:PCMD domain-containing protein [Muribaculaceae bacterium]
MRRYTAAIWKCLAAIVIFTSASTASGAQPGAEVFEYGDFNSWITRNIPESQLIGGNIKTLYEIGPSRTIDGAKAYKNLGNSPWATSNVYAKVMGISKGSCAVTPDTRSGSDKCAKLTSIIERCKAVGIINIDVMVAGSIFLGEMLEPIGSTSNPYSKMEMGIPFTRRPKALVFDYKLSIPKNATRIYSSGFGKKKELPGHESAEVMVLLQRRWEDSDGNLYAKRVGTARIRFDKSTSGWVNGYRLPVMYGDITSNAAYRPYMGLIPADKSYHARNSKGKMVPVTETGWDSSDATPTHIIVMASAASGEAYTGTPGLTFWIDNIGTTY